MNLKYRKKPVVIEAFQMTRERRGDNRDWPDWLHYAWQMDPDEVGALRCRDYPDSDGTDELYINTLEGRHQVSFDDYIIRGVAGELYPCKPDIFEATYEPVSQELEAEGSLESLNEERKQAGESFVRLIRLINGPEYSQLDKEQRWLVLLQESLMESYLTILDRRIQLLKTENEAAE